MMNEMQPIQAGGDLKINISLNYQLYLHDLIKFSTVAYLQGRHYERSMSLEELKRGIQFKMKKEQKEDHHDIQMQINRLRPRIQFINQMEPKDRTKKDMAIIDYFSYLCGVWHEELVTIMDDQGMLMPTHKTGADAVMF